MVVALLKLNFLKVKFILISIPTIYLSGKFPPPRKYPSVLFYKLSILFTNFMKPCALPCFNSGESVMSFESIFYPEQGYTKVTALKLVLVATGL